jgi:nucleotide-binding universal stress UspA family protein
MQKEQIEGKGAMKRILISVDDTKGSKAVIPTLQNLAGRQEDLILLHVERIAGRSLMIGMLGDAEMSTLKDSLAGTEYKEKLDAKAEKILTYYKKELEDVNFSNISTIIRAGHPAEEIIKVADEENADLIVIGNDIKGGLSRLLIESVASDVKKSAKVPVVIAERPIMCEAAYTWRDAYAAITVTTVLFFGMFLLGAIL